MGLVGASELHAEAGRARHGHHLIDPEVRVGVDGVTHGAAADAVVHLETTGAADVRDQAQVQAELAAELPVLDTGRELHVSRSAHHVEVATQMQGTAHVTGAADTELQGRVGGAGAGVGTHQDRDEAVERERVVAHAQADLGTDLTDDTGVEDTRVLVGLQVMLAELVRELGLGPDPELHEAGRGDGLLERAVRDNELHGLGSGGDEGEDGDEGDEQAMHGPSSDTWVFGFHTDPESSFYSTRGRWSPVCVKNGGNKYSWRI